jgi:hypothetical protein
VRSWGLKVGTVGIEGNADSGLEIAFDVVRSLGGEPNTASIRVWGLSRAHRQELEKLSVKGKRPGKIATELRAGYDDQQFLLFKGDLRYARNERDGQDWLTTVEGDDGGRAHLDAQVQRAFPPGTLASQVAIACAEALGLGLGNLPSALAGLTTTYAQGTVLSGLASAELRGVLAGLGLNYSVQHGSLQVVRRGAGLPVPIVKISSGKGLVGSPTRSPEGYVLAVAFLRPGFDPGARVQVESQDIRGVYTSRAVKYEGDASGNPWYAHLELRE